MNSKTDNETCPTCSGSGTVQQPTGVRSGGSEIIATVICPSCHGRGTR